MESWIISIVKLFLKATSSFLVKHRFAEQNSNWGIKALVQLQQYTYQTEKIVIISMASIQVAWGMHHSFEIISHTVKSFTMIPRLCPFYQYTIIPLHHLRYDVFWGVRGAQWSICYRVFIKYCVFSLELSLFCDLSIASTGLLLAVQKWSIRVTVHSDLLLGWFSFFNSTFRG